ncbi:hypothetical protein [Polynucleobacter sp. AP-Latsch-80-C2]|uniref:hypothetical protein n=1 Tax=Polynucleobacter sp. AP-Latsch-80-C2 TaxID=2576931 RepID=UPI001C0D67AA|nr:hypothetical protein [Polynucleobacter sp. AP-Latsch-80-C2]MBU3624385.1 hypothetical protein [Polynucleobacter sp. AP-Latsch-80-C2]
MLGLTLKSLNNRFYKLTFFVLALGLLNTFLFYLFGGFNTPFPILHDNAFLGLPTRFLISASLRSGIFPLWDPYIGAGVPLHSIYTSIGLSPIIWALSLLRKYDTVLFVLEILVLNFLGFTGMWLWLKTRSSTFIAYLGALSYSLSPYLLFQAKINLEAMGSAVAIPWICLGAYQISKQNSIGVAVLAGGLGLAFTSGYLGTNLLMLELLGIWALLLICIHHLSLAGFDSNKSPGNGWIPIVYFLTSLALCALLLCIPITETLINLGLDFFTKRNVDPFTAAIQLESLKNLFDNRVNPFIADPFGGHDVMLYVPSILIGGLIYALFKPNRVMIAALLAFAVTLMACLSKEYAVAKFLVGLLSGFKEIRFHAWLSILLVFLLITIGSLGLSKLYQDSQYSPKEYKSAILITIIIIIATYFTQADRDWKYLSITALISITSLISFQKIANSSKPTRLLLSICIVFLSLSQIYLASIRWDLEGFNTRFGVQANAIQQRQREAIKNALPAFTIPPNSRDLFPEYPDSENEHYSKRPLIEGYLPQRNPAITKLIAEGQMEILKYYAITSDGKPIRYELTSLTPNQLKIKLLGDLGNQSIVITTPYSPNWRGYDQNHKPLEIQKNKLGLMEISSVNGVHLISMEYEPKWLKFMLSFTILSWAFILIWPLYKILRPNAVSRKQ